MKLHVSDSTVSLVKELPFFCYLRRLFLLKTLKEDILDCHFCKAQIPKRQLFSLALLFCANLLRGLVPQESSTTLSHPFLPSDECLRTLIP